MKLKDSLILGIVLGFIAPWLGMYIYFLAKFSHMGLNGFIHFCIKNPHVQSPIFSLGLILNMAVYYLYYHYHYDKTTKGILLATFIYAPLVVYLKLK
jgi:hypothetical protein